MPPSFVVILATLDLSKLKNRRSLQSFAIVNAAQTIKIITVMTWPDSSIAEATAQLNGTRNSMHIHVHRRFSLDVDFKISHFPFPVHA
jgi:hypothetical protein